MKREATLQIAGALALVAMLSGCGKSGAPGAAGIAATASAASTGWAITATAPTSAAPNGSTNGGDKGPKVPCVDSQRAPITKADIDLYLDVMGAAAARVQQPTANDLDAIRRQKDSQAQLTAEAAANAPAQARAEAQMQQLQTAMNTAMQHGDMDKLKALAAQQIKLAKAQSPVPPDTRLLDDATSSLASNLTGGHADEVIVHERHLDADHWDRLVSVIEEIFPPPDAFMADCGDVGCAPKLTAEQLRCEHEYEANVARNREILAAYEKQIRALEAVVRKGVT